MRGWLPCLILFCVALSAQQDEPDPETAKVVKELNSLNAYQTPQLPQIVSVCDEDGIHRAFQIQVLTVSDNAVSHVGCFFDTGLFGAFGLPEVHPG